MKVLLARPAELRASQGVAPCNDVGLGYLASACVASGAVVELIGWDTPLDARLLRQRLRDFTPDVVGVKVFTPWFRETLKTLQLVRQELPGTITIIGGPHASTSHPEDLFAEFNGVLDFAIAGDGECGMKALLGRLAVRAGSSAGGLCDVPGLIYRDGGCIRANAPCLDTPLDELSEPDWAVQALKSTESNRGGDAVPIMIPDSRGCPGRCGHCMSGRINGRTVRKLTARRLCQVLGELVEGHGVRVFEFSGNSFMAEKGYVIEICEWLLRTGIAVRWGCTGAEYVDTLRDRHLLQMMARAGCSQVHFGIESGDARIVRDLRKPFELRQVAEAVRVTAEAGIAPLGYFMFGFPEETLQQMENTIEYAWSLPLAQRKFCICLPLPGMTSYGALLQRYRLERIDWSRYDFARPSLLPCVPSPGEVQHLLTEARRLEMGRSEQPRSPLQRVRHAVARARKGLLRCLGAG